MSLTNIHTPVSRMTGIAVIIAAVAAGIVLCVGAGLATQPLAELNTEPINQLRADQSEDQEASQAAREWDAVEHMNRADAASRRLAGRSLIAAPPLAMVELARHTSWDEQSTSTLERFITATFDDDTDGSLDDSERIIAIRALRDAAWPQAFDDVMVSDPSLDDEARGAAGAPTLSPRDRRLYHDVDEARRRDQQESGGAGNLDAALDPERRDEITRLYQIKPDGLLSVAELARYVARYKARSAAADLDGDGAINETDLRLFLNVASPIEEKEDAT